MKESRIFREREPIGVRRKEFWDLPRTSYLLSEKFTKQLGHEPDGLIFNPADEVTAASPNQKLFSLISHVLQSYQAGQCPTILKWKPPSHNSIDFRIKIVKESRQGYITDLNTVIWSFHYWFMKCRYLPGMIGQLYVGGLDAPFAEMNANKRELQALDNKIIECRWDEPRRKWVFMRERTDKSFPNSYKTAACNYIKTLLFMG